MQGGGGGMLSDRLGVAPGDQRTLAAVVAVVARLALAGALLARAVARALREVHVHRAHAKAAGVALPARHAEAGPQLWAGAVLTAHTVTRARAWAVRCGEANARGRERRGGAGAAPRPTKTHRRRSACRSSHRRRRTAWCPRCCSGRARCSASRTSLRRPQRRRCAPRVTSWDLARLPCALGTRTLLARVPKVTRLAETVVRPVQVMVLAQAVPRAEAAVRGGALGLARDRRCADSARHARPWGGSRRLGRDRTCAERREDHRREVGHISLRRSLTYSPSHNCWCVRHEHRDHSRRARRCDRLDRHPGWR